MKTPGGWGSKAKVPFVGGGYEYFLELPLNVVHRLVHKCKTKESYAFHNHSTLLQGSQSLEKSLSFSLGP